MASIDNIRSSETHVGPAGGSASLGAIELLKADHRQVEAWFEEFTTTEDPDTKDELAARICNALRVHTQIEEEIFYPAFLETAQDDALHHEAVIEHEGARKLIEEIEESDPEEEYFDARVSVLSEMIRHHVQEEEQAGGMFDLAEKSGMDLDELGAQLEKRKLELMDEDTDAGYDEAVSEGDEVEDDE